MTHSHGKIEYNCRYFLMTFRTQIHEKKFGKNGFHTLQGTMSHRPLTNTSSLKITAAYRAGRRAGSPVSVSLSLTLPHGSGTKHANALCRILWLKAATGYSIDTFTDCNWGYCTIIGHTKKHPILSSTYHSSSRICRGETLDIINIDRTRL